MPGFRSATLPAALAIAVLTAVSPASPVTAPPEVENLMISGTTVGWDVAPGAVTYRFYRANVLDLPNFCAAGAEVVPGPSFNEPANPAAGEAHVFLASAINSAGEGRLGTSSAGASRATTTGCDTDGDGVADGPDNCPFEFNPGQEDLDFDGQGDACQFARFAITLRGQMPLSSFPLEQFPAANEMWGYVSPAGEEYAIIGFRTGTAFVRVTSPTAPGLAGYVGGAGINQAWRDMAVFDEYAYIVSDGDGVGLQIADLSGIDNDVVTLVNTSDLGMGFTDAHNVYVNQSSGYLYLAIPDLNSGLGITAVDLNVDPADPTIAGFWNDADPNVRCHDLQVVSYAMGPAAGKEIAYCFAENDGLRIVDVTDKNNMFRLARLVYPGTTYTHQGWLSEDRQYVFIGDELDELNNPGVSSTTTYIVEVGDPSSPSFVGSFTNGLASIDHNLMVRGELVYEANYSSGLRVFSTCNVNDVFEAGYFDTHLENNNRNFTGAWGVYSRLPSGTVVVSDIGRGLFVLDPRAILSRVNNKCSGGGSHDPICDPCIAQICTATPSCCATAWDASCIEDVRTVCGSLICAEAAGSCAHGLCGEGGPLTPFCDTPPAQTSCVDTICQAAPDCCALGWDSNCVDRVSTDCGLSCD